MTSIYGHLLFETFTKPRKFNLLMRALHAGWAPNTKLSNIYTDTLVLEKDNHLLFLTPTKTYTVKTRLPKKLPGTIGTLFTHHYRLLKFDPKNPFIITNISYNNTAIIWQFNLLNPSLGLQEQPPLPHRLINANEIIYNTITKFIKTNNRPPASHELIDLVCKKLNYYKTDKIRKILKLNNGKFWNAIRGPSLKNPNLKTTIYYHPIISPTKT